MINCIAQITIAIIEYYENGNIQSQQYWINNQLHKTNDKPASIEYWKNGNVKCEEYFINNNPHRDNENDPVKIEYSENKSNFSTFTYKNGNVEKFDLFMLFTKSV